MSDEDARGARSYTATVKGKQHRITVEEVERFASVYFRDHDLRSRVSRLLIVDLWVYMVAFDQNPAQITCEIEGLEGRERRPRGTKAATKFDKPPLVGLWHKHWFSSLFMARNLQTGLNKERRKQLVQEMMEIYQRHAGSSSTIDEAAADAISREFSHKAVRETLDLRTASQALTGQWIVFAKHEGKNYYLCLNTHKAGDPAIFARIRDHCFIEFPFLRFLLAP